VSDLDNYVDVRELHPQYEQVGCKYCDATMWAHASFTYNHDEGICRDCSDYDPVVSRDWKEVRV